MDTTKRTRRNACLGCGRTDTVDAIDNHGKPYQGCARCVVAAAPGIPEMMAVHNVMTISAPMLAALLAVVEAAGRLVAAEESETCTMEDSTGAFLSMREALRALEAGR